MKKKFRFKLKFGLSLMIAMILLSVRADSQWIPPSQEVVSGGNVSPWVNGSSNVFIRTDFPQDVLITGTLIGFSRGNHQNISSGLFFNVTEGVGNVNLTGLESCPTGESIRVINPDGSVVCEADTVGDPAGWFIGNDIIFNNTGTAKVGINTSTPSTALEVDGDLNVSGSLTVLNVLPPANDSGSIGFEQQRWAFGFFQVLNVSELGGFSPIIVSAEIISDKNITSNFFKGSGKFLTDINASNISIFSNSSGFANQSNFAQFLNESNFNFSVVSPSCSAAEKMLGVFSNGTPVCFVDTGTDTQKFGGSPFLFNDSTTIFLNQTLLNITIDNRVVVVSNDNDWVVGDGVLFNSTNGTKVGIGTSTPQELFEVSTTPVNTTLDNNIFNVTVGYRFEENGGIVAVDSGSFELNGTITGAQFQDSKGSNGTGNFSLLLDGVNDFVQIPNNVIVNISDNFTLGSWVFLNTSKAQNVIYKINSPTGHDDGYQLYIDGTEKLHLSVRRAGVYTRLKTDGSILVPLNEWTHVVGTISGTNITLYINGVSVPTTSSTRGLTGSGTDLFFGVTAGLFKDLDGGLDEVFIINSPLDDVQVLDIFNNGFPTNATSATNISSGGPLFQVTEEGQINVLGKTGRSVFNNDVQIIGTLIGGSPVKIQGGIKVIDGDFVVNEGNFNILDGSFVVEGKSDFIGSMNVSGIINVNSNVTINDSLVASDIIDLTQAYDKTGSEAIQEIRNIRSNTFEGKKELDHNSLPEFVQRDVVVGGVEMQGRSLGGMVSILTESIKWLQDQMDDKNTRVIDLEKENNLLKKELCNRDTTYSWCSR